MNYDKEINIGSISIVHDDYPQYLQPLHGDLPFLSKKIKINRAIKLICTFYNKKIIYLQLDY